MNNGAKTCYIFKGLFAALNYIYNFMQLELNKTFNKHFDNFT